VSVAAATQVGVKAEGTYGTPVTVDRFFEFDDESVSLDVGRIEGKAQRSGTRVQRSDRFVVDRKGAGGSLVVPVMSKGWGFWLDKMLGTVATTGPTDSKSTHTGTIGTLLGKFFTYQVARPFNPSGTAQAFTYHGGKVTKWELSNTVEGLLMSKFDLDFEDEDTSTGLATASYPTAMEHLSFAGGVVTIGGSSVDVTDAKVSCDLKLKTNRRFLRGSTLKKEPVETGWRELAWELEAEFTDLTQHNRYVSATASGALAAIVLTWTAPTLIGAASFPTLVVTIPAARFDKPAPTVSGTDPLMQKIGGKVLFDGTNSPVTVAYGTADATP
jgi:hypothetical protein